MKKRVISLVLCLLMVLSLIPTTAFAEIQSNNISTMTFKIVNGTWNLPQGTNATLSSDKKEVTFTTYWSTKVQAYVYECSLNNSNSLEAFLNAILGSGGNPATYITPDDGYTLSGMTNQDWAVNAGGMKANGSLSANQQMNLIRQHSHSYDTHGNDERDGFYADTVYTLTLTKSSYTVKYDLNGGKTTSTTTEFTGLTYNQTTPTIDNPTKEGYTFAGWNPSVAEKVIADAVYVAQWTEIETVDIPVKKVWDCTKNGVTAPHGDSVTVTLLQNGNDIDRTLTLTKDGNWTGTFSGLRVKDDDGVNYVYTVVDSVPGYTTTPGNADNNYTVTNTANWITPEVKSLPDLKIAKVDGDNKVITTGEATFELKKDGDSTGTTITTSAGYGTFADLEEGTYTLTETQAPNDYKLGTVNTWTVKVEAGTPYAEEVRDNDGNLTGYKKVTPCTVTVEGMDAASDIYSITNEAIEKTDITVTKVWYDMDNKFGLRPDSITVQLYTTDANGENLTAVTGKTLTLTAKNSWKGAFADLPQFNKDGSAIYYTVAEVNASDRYTSTVAKDNNGNFTITNTLMTGKLMIQKSLMDANGYIRADKDLTFTFDVYAKDADITKDAPVLAGVTVTVKAGDDLAWTVQPVQLPVGDYIVVERGAADKSVAAPSGYTYRFNDITYSAPQAKPDVNALAAADPTVPEFASIVADRITWADVNNCYAHDPYTVTIPVTKTVTKALNSIDPGKVTFTFKAQLQLSDGTWVDLACTNNTITLTGTGTKSTEMSVTIPSEYFSVMTPVVTLRIIEVNDGLPNWKYADNACEIKATVKDGAINLEYAGPVAFTNTYSYTYTPPRPRPNPKPVPSAKTGDMGIALYALTSLLSLSGTALVIKKRKDEE